DIWSTACTIFEMATGKYLFKLEEGTDDGTVYTLADDHLARIIELQGPIPSAVFKKGACWKDFFDEKGDLLKIKNLTPFPMMEYLEEKYKWNPNDAEQITSFLAPMLEFDKDDRATAARCLQHDWLQPAPAVAAEGSRRDRE
ncbi:hypothetical protein PENTCL1PPCAC_9730, partial [Pristionchus entomophagus]